MRVTRYKAPRGSKRKPPGPTTPGQWGEPKRQPKPKNMKWGEGPERAGHPLETRYAIRGKQANESTKPSTENKSSNEPSRWAKTHQKANMSGNAKAEITRTSLSKMPRTTQAKSKSKENESNPNQQHNGQGCEFERNSVNRLPKTKQSQGSHPQKSLQPKVWVECGEPKKDPTLHRSQQQCKHQTTLWR